MRTHSLPPYCAPPTGMVVLRPQKVICVHAEIRKEAQQGWWSSRKRDLAGEPELTGKQELAWMTRSLGVFDSSILLQSGCSGPHPQLPACFCPILELDA